MLEPLGLSELAETVYLAMLGAPNLGVAGIARRLDMPIAEVRRSLDELVDLALLTESADGEGLRPVGPGAGLTALIARAEADIARRQAQIESTRAAVAQLASIHRNARAQEQTVLLEGIDAVRARIEELAAEATTECVSLNPNVAQTPDAKAASAPLNQQMIERGVAIRSVYQDSFRNDPGLLGYARAFVRLGIEIRTAPTIPIMMIIYDRRTALLPIDPTASRLGAQETCSHGIVAAAYALFEHIWATATPIDAPPVVNDHDLEPQQLVLLRILADGGTDEMAARKLGVSVRTVKRMSAELMSKLDARSRFEAGVKAVRNGWI